MAFHDDSVMIDETPGAGFNASDLDALVMGANVSVVVGGDGGGDDDGNNLTARGVVFVEQRFIHTVAFQIVICLAYGLVFLVGMMGNILVCYIVYSRKHMQNVTNYFITNLALADILLCILAVPFTPLYTFLGKWVFGSVMCRLVASAQGVSVYISSLTLTSIAIDRFIVILYPFRPRMQVSTCVLMIVLIWIFSVVAMAPYSVFIRITRSEEGEPYCSEEWPSEFIRRMFGIFTVKLQFIVPFVIISICYMKISMALGTRVRNMSKSRTSRKDEMERERKRKTNRMLIAMVAIFGISWLPMNLVNFISDLYKPAEAWPYFQMTFSLTHMLAMSSTCYNPILYAWLNETFRKEFKEVLPCWRSFEDDTGRVSNRLVSMRPSLRHRANGVNNNNNNNHAVSASAGAAAHVVDVDADDDDDGTPVKNSRGLPGPADSAAGRRTRAAHGDGDGDDDDERSRRRRCARKGTEISVVTSTTRLTQLGSSPDLESSSGSRQANKSNHHGHPPAVAATLNCQTMEITFSSGPAAAAATGAVTPNGVANEADRDDEDDDDDDDDGMIGGGDVEMQPLRSRNSVEFFSSSAGDPPGYKSLFESVDSSAKRENRRLLTSDL